jgi:hypothetical protein
MAVPSILRRKEYSVPRTICQLADNRPREAELADAGFGNLFPADRGTIIPLSMRAKESE